VIDFTPFLVAIAALPLAATGVMLWPRHPLQTALYLSFAITACVGIFTMAAILRDPRTLMGLTFLWLFAFLGCSIGALLG
jgi:hypothetical protein